MEIDERPLTAINSAQNDDPFIWCNRTIATFPGFGGGGWLADTDWIERVIETDEAYVEDLEACGEDVPEECFRSWEDFEERVEKKYPTFYSAYRLMVTEKYAEILWDRLQKNKYSDIITSMKFDHLWSPHDYWRATDHLNVRMTCNWRLLDEWILKHRDEFDKYLKKYWSPCEGWIPWVPNVYEELRDSQEYREICIDFLLYHVIEKEDDEATSSFEQTMSEELLEWQSDLSVQDVIARIEEPAVCS